MDPQIIIRQIDYYFSDFNLQQNKYLRTFLDSSENNAITIEHILKFKKINFYVDGDSQKLISILNQFNNQLQYCEFNAETESLRRLVNKQFVFDKKFLRKHSDRIIYLSKLPIDATIDKIQHWLSTDTNRCSVYAIKRGLNDTILTALIAYEKKDIVEELLSNKATKNGWLKLKIGKKSETFKCKVKSYLEYEKIKMKRRRKCRKLRDLSKELANLSISDKSNDSGIVLGRESNQRIVKRTLLLKCSQLTNDLKIDDIKSCFKEFNVIYVYKISKDVDPGSYFILFLNRSSIKRFIQMLDNETININLKDTTLELNSKHFNVVEVNNLPSKFELYVKRVKAFFRKRNISSC
ncbi:hypothetical protein RDWZM_008487 [Blomia tropicalis]|uniref:HTH La-type RNA-binding domain-containing protein n=1 Tax=Blomia tropicalis TaxID=40697 RepID=A0A9Q0RKD8_BLOTA|nr:hypothetical protein RDWZM_008487 [Blomia tropicalis]